MTLSYYTQNTSGQVTNFYSDAPRASYEFFADKILRDKFPNLLVIITKYMANTCASYSVSVRTQHECSSMGALRRTSFFQNSSGCCMQISHCRPSAAKAVSLWHAAGPGLGQVLVGMANEPPAPIMSSSSIGAKWPEGVGDREMGIIIILNLKPMQSMNIAIQSTNKRVQIIKEFISIGKLNIIQIQKYKST